MRTLQVTVNLSDLNMTHSSGAVAVRDIWEHKDLGTFHEKFVTDAFGGHDSRFYLFTPA
jgi:hypothetical protein